jgi:alanine racemase
MFFVDFLRQIRKKILHHEPLIAVEISRENLLHNLNEFKKIYPKLEFAPVLKSNAYGHGIVEMAKILDQENSPFFCVDSFFEARQLRHEGIKTKILIIGYVRPEEIRSSRLKNAAFTIVDLEQLKEIGNIPSCPRRGGPMRHRTGVVGEEKDTPIGEINNHPLPLLEKEGSLFRKKIKIHLKIDTGMHRQGILLSEIEETIKIIKNSKNMILEGICSHLADADNSDEKFTLEQIENWN